MPDETLAPAEGEKLELPQFEEDVPEELPLDLPLPSYLPPPPQQGFTVASPTQQGVRKVALGSQRHSNA